MNKLYSLEALEFLLEGKHKDIFISPDDTVFIRNISHKDFMKQLLDAMRENEENCRIIGMSGETELALRAKIEVLERENERLKDSLGKAIAEIRKLASKPIGTSLIRERYPNKDF